MNIDLYSDRAKQAIQSAQSLALARGHQQLAPEHLLKVLLEEKDGLARQLIESAGGKPDVATSETDALIAKLPKVEGGSGQLYMTPETASVFAEAEAGAKAAGDAFVTTERLLAAIAKDGADAAAALKKAGVTPAGLETAAAAVRKGRTADSASAEEGYDALKRYARDLTQAARDDKLDPVIGRDEEIRRTIQVLSRRTKNNPVLIGEPGVGKTAIVEGLALRIVNGDVRQRPVGELVALICRDLDLDPDWTRLAEEAWAKEEIASGVPSSPFLQQSPSHPPPTAAGEAGPAFAFDGPS